MDEVEFPPVSMPVELTSAERVVWERLAPLALQRKTLTENEVESFRRLCKSIVFADLLEAKVIAEDFETTKVTLQMDATGGGLQNVEKKKHHLLSELRGWHQRVEAGLAKFKLAPMGKAVPLPVKEKPKSALEQLQAQRPGIRAVR